MKIEGEAKRLRIYIGESDQWHGESLATAIVKRCRKEGLAGATVLRGVQGFGANSRIHTTHILDLSSDLPIVVEIIDKPERIAQILPALDEMVTEGLITEEPVHIIKYTQNKQQSENAKK
jgi:PII-like signaling protein